MHFPQSQPKPQLAQDPSRPPSPIHRRRSPICTSWLYSSSALVAPGGVASLAAGASSLLRWDARCSSTCDRPQSSGGVGVLHTPGCAKQQSTPVHTCAWKGPSSSGAR
jgi:hypothetical protein